MADIDTLMTRATCRPGDLVLDCGAYIGRTVDQFLGAGAATVFGFEPNPTLFEGLRSKFDGEPRVRLFNIALSDRNGTAELDVPDFNHGAGSIVKAYATAQAESRDSALATVAVETRTLDDLALPACSYWKIDVEGAEAQVFRGAERTLARHRPRFVQVEIFGPPANPPGYRPGLLRYIGKLLDCDGWVLGLDHDGKAVRLDWELFFRRVSDPEAPAGALRAIRRVRTPVFGFWTGGATPEIPQVDVDAVR